jgi:peroxiredoxin family protein
MGGIILLSGARIYVADYAQLMLHDPSIMGESIESTKDEKVKRALTSLRDSLSTIIQNRTKKTKMECDAIMNAETWYNASQAKNEGFVDEVISYAKRPKIKAEMTTDEILLAVASEYQSNNITIKKMDNILKFLGLAENSTEQDAISAIEKIKLPADNSELITIKAENAKLVEDKTSVTNELEQLKATKNELDAKVIASVTEIEVLNEKVLQGVIDMAIMVGKFTEKDREALAVQFKNNVSGLQFVIKNSASSAINIIGMLNKGNEGEDVTANWGFAEWSKNDPKGLKNIQENDKKKYNAIGRKTYGNSWIDEV